MCTHLHVDHCGWNTRLLDGRWAPMVPDAKQLSKAESEHWRGPAGKEGINLMYVDHPRSFGIANEL